MSTTARASSSRAGLVRRAARASWLVPLAIFAAARVVSGLFLAHAAQVQPDLTDHPGWHVEGLRPASPGYWDILSNWDGQWFKTIALHGYGTNGESALDQQNSLAFSPLYPMLVRAVMAVTGLGFEVAGSLVALVSAALAMVLLYRWLLESRGRGPAIAAVVVLSAFPSAPILQATYSDGLALLLVVICCRAVVERHWAVLLPAAAALSLTRPVLLPMAAFVVLVDWRRPVTAERRGPVGRPAMAVALSLVGLSFLWPFSAGLLAGQGSAYFTTMGAWRQDGLAVGGWFTALWSNGLWIPALMMAGIIVALLALRWRRRREIGTSDQLGLWAGTYLLFMLVTAPVSAGIIRHALLTLVPLTTIGPMAPTSSRTRRALVLAGVVVVELVLQYLWVRHVFVVADPTRARIP